MSIEKSIKEAGIVRNLKGKTFKNLGIFSWVVCRVGTTGRQIRLFLDHVPRGCRRLPNFYGHGFESAAAASSVRIQTLGIYGSHRSGEKK